jgi:hypothetical protein
MFLAQGHQHDRRPDELALNGGGDCNTPAGDPMHVAMACDKVQMGTGVAVTLLAIAKKLPFQPAEANPQPGHLETADRPGR